MSETAPQHSPLPHVVIHTDGACSRNPGPGGWGAILAFGDHEKELKEYTITPQGFKIEGGFSNYENVMSGSAHRVASERFVDMFQKASEKHKGGLSH